MHILIHVSSPPPPPPFEQNSKAIVPLQLDPTGKVKYDTIARMGQRKDKVIHTSLQAMVQQDRPSNPELVKPDEEEIEKVSAFKTFSCCELCLYLADN